MDVIWSFLLFVDVWSLATVAMKTEISWHHLTKGFLNFSTLHGGRIAPKMELIRCRASCGCAFIVRLATPLERCHEVRGKSNYKQQKDTTHEKTSVNDEFRNGTYVTVIWQYMTHVYKLIEIVRQKGCSDAHAQNTESKLRAGRRIVQPSVDQSKAGRASSYLHIFGWPRGHGPQIVALRGIVNLKKHHQKCTDATLIKWPKWCDTEQVSCGCSQLNSHSWFNQECGWEQHVL